MDETKRNGALVLGGLAVVAFAFYAFTGRGDGKPTCALTTAAVALIVTGVTEGRGTAAIVGPAAAGIFVPTACAEVVDSLIQKPAEEVKLEITAPDGSTAEETAPGTEILSPPPQELPSTVDPARVQRIVDCLRYKSSLLFRLCVDGGIGPPAR